jgi:peptidoglycan/xylan/chitin deacetylase (PgdA/CDA1 family)
MSVQVPILLYHSVAQQVAPRFRRYAISPEVFAAHMAFLHDNGYTPLTVSEFARSIADSRRRLPERPMVITFDDGLADFYTNAFPVLKGYGFAATLYIVTGFVGGTSRWLCRQGEGERPILTWEQIDEINTNGIECGAHSHSHPQLDTLPLAEAREEIMHSKAVLEQRLGQPVLTFAYPHGYYSSAVRRIVQQAGYSSACAVKHGVSTPADDRFALARIAIYSSTDVEHFARLLMGRGLPVAPMRERARTKSWRLVRRSATLLKRNAHL